MSSTPEFNREQLAAARAQRWRQVAEGAVRTLEDARSWVDEMGLVLFAPRGQSADAATPSLVEATLGRAASAVSEAEAETARGLVARLTAEGAAVPLNLLGGGGDVPDFLASAQVFSYVFTLRGDKAWKQPPGAAGAVRVSPLALKVYEALTAREALTAGELASELGREVTEGAILRGLGELWAQLRVIPLLEQDGSATRWELVTRRFTKLIKAGANAGVPTALSALISVYLGHMLAATAEEIETFVSPLIARSRVRDVVHGLTAARQVDEVVLEGKTLLYIPGTLPEFPAARGEETSIEGVEAAAAEPPKKIGTGRIRSFEGKRRPAGELRGKPERSFTSRRSGVGGARPAGRFGARADGARPGGRFGGGGGEGKSDRERRPFQRESAAGGGKPSFSRPWDEERKARPARSASAGAPDSFKKFRKPGREEHKPLGDREQAGLPPEERVFSKPRFERESKARDFAKRPDRHGEASGERGAFKPRSYERSDRSNRDRGGADRRGKPGGFGAKRPYKPRDAEGGERSFAKRPYTPRTAEGGERSGSKPRFERGTSRASGARPGGFGAKRPYKPRDAEGGERTFTKRPYAPRTAAGGERSGSKPRFERGTKTGGFGAKRPYKPRDAEGGERTFAKRPYTPRTAEGGERGGDSVAKRPYKPRSEGGFKRGEGAATKSFGTKKFGAKPAGKFGGKPGAKFSGRPGTKFGGRPGAKFGGKPGAKFGSKPGKFGPKKFGAKSGGYGAKRGGPAGKAKPAPRKPEAEE